VEQNDGEWLAMVELSAEQVAQRAFDLNLVDERQLAEVWGQIGTRQVSGEEFQQLLLRRELLTNYQTKLLERGETSGYFYGDYKVLYLIGTGTFARVYRACHKTTGEIVAVKVLRRKFSDNKEEAERFVREGEMGATLKHPNIVPIMEVHSARTTHYLVLKFVEGRNLREFIKIRKKFEPLQAARLVVDMVAGLSYAATRGICHRDLKMSNIIVSSKGTAMLLDFGLAGGEAADEQNPRTIDYAGLERITGVRKDDPRSDIYFLGCIFYHMLSGHPALVETKDKIQRLSRSRFTDVVPLLKHDQTIPKSIVQVVNRAKELNADARYQTPAEMLAELRAAINKSGDPNAADSDDPSKPAAAAAVTPSRTLMFVESNVSLQDVLRERLKSNGYRVLVTADPDRALSRFTAENKAADCVIFSTGELGETALAAFNRFAEGEHTRDIPAVLLLGEHHLEWKQQAKLDKHRAVLAMPIKLRQFREVLAKLVPLNSASKSA
jgi:serine/threonine protein kinase